ncbi:MAG: hypothetical protein H0T53_01605 [Herpetosiphonaceae bacterium]|nr:hypothetical protein [Herpetosiphonaceae bacterium]
MLDLYCDRGVEGLIEWRSIDVAQSQCQHRLNANLDDVCRGLAAEVKAEIRLHIDHILAAAASLNMPLSLHTLLLDPPSSPRRRRLKRRLNRTRKRQSDVAVTATQLASAYAERASLNKPEAKFRIHAFITYGPIGLLPPSLWQSSIDADMFEWLKLMKLGHPEGSVRWGDIYTQAAIYSNEYDLPTYSSQILHSIYNSIDKTRYWHGGKGLVVLKVHQRFPTVITSRPRLNAEWLVRSCRLPIAIVPNTKDSYLTLVADSEAQLSLGLWLSSTPPTKVEIGIAIYQAIWHIGSIDFPIRGIPQAINIPAALVDDDIDDLQRAATYLLTKIDIDQKPSMRGKRRIIECLTNLQLWAEEINNQTPRSFIPLTQLMRELLDRLVEHSFPFHRQDVVPASIRRTGHALPGSSTPAAGWLLPRLGTATPSNGIINISGARYVVPKEVANGRLLPYRALPVFFPEDDEAGAVQPMFLELTDTRGARLIFCTPLQ